MRQAVGRHLRSMGGSELKGAGSKGHAASAAGSLTHMTKCPYRWQSSAKGIRSMRNVFKVKVRRQETRNAA